MRVLALTLVGALFGVAASAQPVPAVKPAQEAERGDSLGEFINTLPRRKPRPPAVSPEPVARERASADTRRRLAASATGASGCEARLAALGVQFSVAPPIKQGACGAPRPLQVSAIGDAALKPAAVVRCPVALSTAEWLSDVVQPAARRELRTEVAAIYVAASYACRRRNNQSTGRLSEHGLANAIDVRGFGLENGQEFAVAPARSRRGRQVRFQKAIREGACEFFGTVLGPGADAFHDDHLHFDMRQRRRAFCR
ncbi:MAG: extensin family protein [Pseudomonadota bacterium]